MKFTLSWLREHLDTAADIGAVADAMTAVGMEVEHVVDSSAKLAAFSVARIVEAVQHPNADRLRVCQVDTVDGRKEIVCGAPNARAGLTTVYAPLGAYIPGTGITLEPKPVRGVVSRGMLCSAAELELAGDSDGILELSDDLPVGAPAAQVFGSDPVIDFEVTPNRGDWLGVAGIARDLAAAGLGALTTPPVGPVAGAFPCPVAVRIDAPDMCPMFAGRVIRGVANGPSPEWLQARLRAVGLRPISALVDVTNLISLDRARPLHVYDTAKMVGSTIVARAGKPPAETPDDAEVAEHPPTPHAPEPHGDEELIALDGKTYDLTPAMCVIADAGGARPIGLGGVMGGASTGVDEGTTEVFVESAWFDPLVTAQTGRALGISSDAQYRFARGVDPDFVLPGLELATRLILDLCGGEPSEVTIAGQPPAGCEAFDFDTGLVLRLGGLDVGAERTREVLTALGFDLSGPPERLSVRPPSWRRDVDGPADLVEEVTRIVGFDAIPAAPLPLMEPKPGGVLTPLQVRARLARRVLAASGWREAVTWSFTRRDKAALFGGGGASLVLANPIASELDCMRPSILPNLIEAVGRNAARGFPDAALFEVGPVYAGDAPADQGLAVAAVLGDRPARSWSGAGEDPLFALKAELLALLEELGAPVSTLQVVQPGEGGWWHPGRSAALKLGPKLTLASFGELHPATLKALDVAGPLQAFELRLDALPPPRRRPAKTRAALALSALMPLHRDFAFVVARATPAGDLVRAAAGADKALIAQVRVFDVYEGPGLPDGAKSVALEVTIQPRDRTLADAEIEALSARIVAAVAKVGGELRT